VKANSCFSSCGLLISEVVEVSFKFFVDSVFYLELLQESVLEAQKHVFMMCKNESQKLVTKYLKLSINMQASIIKQHF